MTVTKRILRVGNLMSVDPVTIGPDESAAEAELLIRQYRISGLPVVAGGVVVGVISQTDLLTARSSELIGANWDRVRVRHLMSRPAITVHLNTTVERAARLMLDEHIHRVVVVDDEDVPIGVVTTTDLLESILDDEPHNGAAGPMRRRYDEDDV